MKQLKAIFTVLGVLCLFILNGCSSGGGTNSNLLSREISSHKAITEFSLSPVIGGNITQGVIIGQNINVIMPFGTNVSSLVATFTILGANVTVGKIPQKNGTTSNDFSNSITYTVTASDGSQINYIVTVTVASSSAKAITNFSLNGTSGVIAGESITVVMPFETDVTALIAHFTISGANISVGGLAQKNGTTPNNFSKPVIYTVTAADGSQTAYTVIVTVASSSAKAITNFSLNGTSGVIAGESITVVMPFGTNVTELIAHFTILGANISVGGLAQDNGITPNNFNAPITYAITAADSSVATYTVTVIVALNSAKAINSFSLHGVDGVINESAIVVTLPSWDIDRTDLIATFLTTGATVKVESMVQTSGATPNDFSSPVTYTVTAADGSIATYMVTVRGPRFSYAYALDYGNDNNLGSIATYLQDENTGVLLLSSQISAGDGPVSVAFAPSKQRAYVTTLYNGITTYDINTNTGELTEVSTLSLPPYTNPLYTELSPSGNVAFLSIARAVDMQVSNPGVNAYSINSDGLLTSTGNLPNYNDLAFSKSGAFAYIVNPGSNAISMYSLNDTTSGLTALSPATVDNEVQPGWVTLSPSGKYLYVSNFSSNSITQYSVDNITGQLSALNTISTESNPETIIFAPSGKFVYVTNQTNKVSTYSVNKSTGQLTALGQILAPAKIGAVKYNAFASSGTLTFSPSGNYIYISNNMDWNIYIYNINTNNGQLGTLIGTVDHRGLVSMMKFLF